MKKTIMLIGAIALMTSCTVSRSIELTGEPIGTKTGIAKTKIFAKDQDISLKKASENGKIKKIGAVEHILKQVVIFPVQITKVYGE